MDGMIFDLKKFAVNDGPGIRTTVFLKGCPLRCVWCHNPESQMPGPELSFDAGRCIGCGNCAAVCPNGLEKEKCTLCGQCITQCYANAREIIGCRESVEKIMEEVMKDKIFYDNSGGGMTISGGEPLFQAAFTAELLKAAGKQGVHTCLDTSGFASRKILEKVIPLVDLFLYDLKETDARRHLLYTGVALDGILENLTLIDRAGGQIYLRCPLIPALNVRPEHANGIADVANRLDHLLEINLMPYHPLGESKAIKLGREPAFTAEFADKNNLEDFRQQIAEKVHVPVKIS